MDKNRRHNQQQRLLYSGGAAYSVDAEYLDLGAGDKYLDACNMRLVNLNGHDYALSAVPGELIVYDNGTQPKTYKCMYARSIADRFLFEIWCDKNNPPAAPFIRINGTIVLQSQNFPYSVNYGIQGDVDENAFGYEITITDYNAPPHQYNIKDLLENSGINFETGQPDSALTPTQKYFSQYDDKKYLAQLIVYPDHPVFIGVTASPAVAAYGGAAMKIGGSGIKAGSYIYYSRLKTSSGDATLWSEGTVLIKVPKHIGGYESDGYSNNGGEHVYPYLKTYGGSAGEDTVYGIHIRLRVIHI